jgi:hypothetical protein
LIMWVRHSESGSLLSCIREVGIPSPSLRHNA